MTEDQSLVKSEQRLRLFSSRRQPPLLVQLATEIKQRGLGLIHPPRCPRRCTLISGQEYMSRVELWLVRLSAPRVSHSLFAGFQSLLYGCTSLGGTQSVFSNFSN